ncbi:MAG: ribosomal-processing cysteine protease Prp [Dorea sp.]|nr:ribosomal-processing cysteine protease Prp [Dorea sp.]
MIEVKVRKNHIEVSGHAGHAPPGQDIVCAGVSALTQALLVSIDSLAEDKIKYGISPGRADIYYGNLSEKSCTLVDSFFIGICLIAGEFPDNVRIV